MTIMHVEMNTARKPLRITIVLGTFLSAPPAPCGAVERRWTDSAKQMGKLGHTVTLLCRAYPGLHRRETVDGIEIFRQSGFNSRGKIWFDLMLDFLYSIQTLLKLPRAEILVTNVFWLPSLVTLLRLKSKGKVVVNVARMPSGQMWLYKKCARLLAVSTAVGDAIVHQQPKLEPLVRVIINPINTDVFSASGSDCRTNGERTIVYTGRVHPEKGIPLLIDAFRQIHSEFQGLKLIIVGPFEVERGGGGEDYLRTLQRKADGLSVDFVGPIYDRIELAQVLKSAAVYCYPSQAERGEACPVAPLEAMAAGLPPVVSALDQFKDYLINGETGLIFNHRDTDPSTRLAESLCQLLRDPERARKMGMRAAQVASQYSYEKVVDRYLQDFQSLLEPPEAR